MFQELFRNIQKLNPHQYHIPIAVFAGSRGYHDLITFFVSGNPDNAVQYRSLIHGIIYQNRHEMQTLDFGANNIHHVIPLSYFMSAPEDHFLIVTDFSIFKVVNGKLQLVDLRDEMELTNIQDLLDSDSLL